MAQGTFCAKVSEVAAWVEGRVIGDSDRTVRGVASLKSAGPEQIGFVRDDVTAREAVGSKAGALIVHRPLEGIAAAQIVVKDPSRAFVTVLERYQAARRAPPSGVSPRAEVAADATLGKDVSVGAFSVIEAGSVIGDGAVIYPRVYIGPDVRIGAGTVIYPQVVVREETEIGARCIIHAGTVIGGDGFGYIQRGGRHVKIPQVGRVVIGDDVEIGCLVTVDRAALDETRIGNGVKVDNHSHIAHNVEIGDNTMLVAYAKLAGSVRVGRNVLLAEDVGVSDHVQIGDGAVVGGGSKVYKDLGSREIVWGSPARPINLEKRIQGLLGRLPELRERVRSLEKRVEILGSMTGPSGPPGQPPTTEL